jgi:hypothetical protein
MKHKAIAFASLIAFYGFNAMAGAPTSPSCQQMATLAADAFETAAFDGSSLLHEPNLTISSSSIDSTGASFYIVNIPGGEKILVQLTESSTQAKGIICSLKSISQLQL